LIEDLIGALVDTGILVLDFEGRLAALLLMGLPASTRVERAMRRSVEVAMKDRIFKNERTN